MSKYITALILVVVSVIYYYLVSFVFINKTIISTSMITLPLIVAGFSLIFAADFNMWSLVFLGIYLIIYLLTMLASINQFKKNNIIVNLALIDGNSIIVSL
ncbi:MAG: hypothetical protein WDA24_00740 [Tissierellales bacterium]